MTESYEADPQQRKFKIQGPNTSEEGSRERMAGQGLNGRRRLANSAGGSGGWNKDEEGVNIYTGGGHFVR